MWAQQVCVLLFLYCLLIVHVLIILALSQTKENKTKQNKTKQNKTKQNKTKQNKDSFIKATHSFHSYLSIKICKINNWCLIWKIICVATCTYNFYPFCQWKMNSVIKSNSCINFVIVDVNYTCIRFIHRIKRWL